MGSGTGPSFLDVLLVNKHYNCLEKCNRYNTKCANGGYAHPRRCDVCTCPSGFGGQFCETKEHSPGCGGTLFATRQYATLSWTSGQQGTRDDMSYCHWWIQSQSHEQIEVKITRLSAPCWEGCLFGGLEVKASYDKRLTGYRQAR
ncbi:unnamed protein product [Toxocara canis]|uniref:Peptidase M12A domain-containing protein n=1 Tax=Toxocara canis TaxID=6265 RepID=A0A183U0R3_TOXCA|nr:unnamed protein product [Toxocara canis]